MVKDPVCTAMQPDEMLPCMCSICEHSEQRLNVRTLKIITIIVIEMKQLGFTEQCYASKMCIWNGKMYRP